MLVKGARVRALWVDGNLYGATVTAVDKKKKRADIMFDDNTMDTLAFRNIFFKCPGSKVQCDSCGKKDSSENKIITCCKCQFRYHQNCHVPKIKDWTATKPFTCRLCLCHSGNQQDSVTATDPVSEVAAVKMKTVRPYKLSDLTWDQTHKVNNERIYCYCGGPACWYIKMLQCAECMQWYHNACIMSDTPGLLLGDRFYHFICLCCNGGEEVLEKIKMDSPEDAMQLALFNMQEAQHRKFFDYQTDILPWLREQKAHLSLTFELDEGSLFEVLLEKPNKFKWHSGSGRRSTASLFGLRVKCPPKSTRTTPLSQGHDESDKSVSSSDISESLKLTPAIRKKLYKKACIGKGRGRLPLPSTQSQSDTASTADLDPTDSFQSDSESSTGAKKKAQTKANKKSLVSKGVKRKHTSSPDTGQSKHTSSPDTGQSKRTSSPDTGQSKHTSSPDTGQSKQPKSSSRSSLPAHSCALEPKKSSGPPLDKPRRRGRPRLVKHPTSDIHPQEDNSCTNTSGMANLKDQEQLVEHEKPASKCPTKSEIQITSQSTESEQPTASQDIAKSENPLTSQHPTKADQPIAKPHPIESELPKADQHPAESESSTAEVPVGCKSMSGETDDNLASTKQSTDAQPCSEDGQCDSRLNSSSSPVILKDNTTVMQEIENKSCDKNVPISKAAPVASTDMPAPKTPKKKPTPKKLRSTKPKKGKKLPMTASRSPSTSEVQPSGSIPTRFDAPTATNYDPTLDAILSSDPAVANFPPKSSMGNMSVTPSISFGMDTEVSSRNTNQLAYLNENVSQFSQTKRVPVPTAKVKPPSATEKCQDGTKSTPKKKGRKHTNMATSAAVDLWGPDQSKAVYVYGDGYHNITAGVPSSSVVEHQQSNLGYHYNQPVYQQNEPQCSLSVPAASPEDTFPPEPIRKKKKVHHSKREIAAKHKDVPYPPVFGGFTQDSTHELDKKPMESNWAASPDPSNPTEWDADTVSAALTNDDTAFIDLLSDMRPPPNGTVTHSVMGMINAQCEPVEGLKLKKQKFRTTPDEWGSNQNYRGYSGSQYTFPGLQHATYGPEEVTSQECSPSVNFNYAPYASQEYRIEGQQSDTHSEIQSTGNHLSPINTPPVGPINTPHVGPINTPTVGPINTPHVGPINTPPVGPINTPPVGPINTPHVGPINTPPVGPINTPHVGPINTPPVGPINTPPVGPINTPHVGPINTPPVGPINTPHVGPINTPPVGPITTPLCTITTPGPTTIPVGPITTLPGGPRTAIPGTTITPTGRIATPFGTIAIPPEVDVQYLPTLENIQAVHNLSQSLQQDHRKMEHALWKHQNQAIQRDQVPELQVPELRLDTMSILRARQETSLMNQQPVGQQGQLHQPTVGYGVGPIYPQHLQQHAAAGSSFSAAYQQTYRSTPPPMMMSPRPSPQFPQASYSPSSASFQSTAGGVQSVCSNPQKDAFIPTNTTGSVPMSSGIGAMATPPIPSYSQHQPSQTPNFADLLLSASKQVSQMHMYAPTTLVQMPFSQPGQRFAMHSGLPYVNRFPGLSAPGNIYYTGGPVNMPQIASNVSHIAGSNVVFVRPNQAHTNPEGLTRTSVQSSSKGKSGKGASKKQPNKLQKPRVMKDPKIPKGKSVSKKKQNAKIVQGQEGKAYLLLEATSGGKHPQTTSSNQGAPAIVELPTATHSTGSGKIVSSESISGDSGVPLKQSTSKLSRDLETWLDNLNKGDGLVTSANQTDTMEPQMKATPAQAADLPKIGVCVTTAGEQQCFKSVPTGATGFTEYSKPNETMSEQLPVPSATDNLVAKECSPMPLQTITEPNYGQDGATTEIIGTIVSQPDHREALEYVSGMAKQDVSSGVTEWSGTGPIELLCAAAAASDPDCGQPSECAAAAAASNPDRGQPSESNLPYPPVNPQTIYAVSPPNSIPVNPRTSTEEPVTTTLMTTDDCDQVTDEAHPSSG